VESYCQGDNASEGGTPWKVIDCHLHLMDFLQKSEGTYSLMVGPDEQFHRGNNSTAETIPPRKQFHRGNNPTAETIPPRKQFLPRRTTVLTPQFLELNGIRPQFLRPCRPASNNFANVSKSVVFGMPCCKKWEQQEPEAPLYYQVRPGD